LAITDCQIGRTIGAGEEMVEYATAGIDENMFISKYKLKLPSKEELTKWLKDQVEELEP
jgi:hypothetical protein